MGINRICLNCGSSAFVSDRSLGGRIVCAKCGSSSFSDKSFSLLSRKKYILFALGIAILIIIIF